MGGVETCLTGLATSHLSEQLHNDRKVHASEPTATHTPLIPLRLCTCRQGGEAIQVKVTYITAYLEGLDMFHCSHSFQEMNGKSTGKKIPVAHNGQFIVHDFKFDLYPELGEVK